MTNKISFEKYDKNLMAKATGSSLPISRKFSIEILNAIRGKKVEYVIRFLDDVINLRKPVPIRRFTGDVGHKSGKNMAAGRFPVKAATHIKGLIESAKKNAIDKGFNTNLVIVHASAMKGFSNYHHGRHPGRETKSTNIEIVVKEFHDSKAKKEDRKSSAKESKKKESKAKPEKKVAPVETKTETKTEKKDEVLEKTEDKKETIDEKKESQ